ncbi:MAG: NUDIX hydrolase [Nanoarchaeota archaeon]
MDFQHYAGTDRDGNRIVYELSAGGILLVDSASATIAQSREGTPQSFTFPKGHIKIVDGFPEDVLAAAQRESREELGLEQHISLLFTGYLTSTHTHQVFPKSGESSFKTIMYAGFHVSDVIRGAWETEGRHVRILSAQDAQTYLVPQIYTHFDACRAHFLQSVNL